jgi:hypothetical protein
MLWDSFWNVVVLDGLRLINLMAMYLVEMLLDRLRYTLGSGLKLSLHKMLLMLNIKSSLSNRREVGWVYLNFDLI